MNRDFKESLFQKIKVIIAEQLVVDANKITRNTNFIRDLGADSLDAVELIMAFEEEFEIEISDEVAEKTTHVQQVVDYISQQVTVK
ncbi:acyl carrier protein [Nostoc sp. FACHB-190]|uniref:acyl carrier protein n=1 Tax=Nostoc sp. FACHB-190 TaxID=2692838 RepID=UPI0016884870|nr:acyl carrier protein [Nostoc sp. FACHB-190]MBD2300639.1 acyl carrier protein [Nostoc sp. FACHB-190]